MREYRVQLIKRKGGPRKEPTKTVRISVKHHGVLDIQSKKYKKPSLSMKEILEWLIDLNEEHDLVTVGWKKRINESLDQYDVNEKKNRFAMLDDACPAYQLVDEFFMCIWAQKNKPPQIKKLSKDPVEALKVCKGCLKTREILEGIESYEETIRNLKVRAKAGIVVSIPRCDLPSDLSDDGLSFWCRRQAKNMTVDKCKTLRKGQPCMNLKWIKVPVKGELTEPEKGK